MSLSRGTLVCLCIFAHPVPPSPTPPRPPPSSCARIDLRLLVHGRCLVLSRFVSLLLRPCSVCPLVVLRPCVVPQQLQQHLLTLWWMHSVCWIVSTHKCVSPARPLCGAATVAIALRRAPLFLQYCCIAPPPPHLLAFLLSSLDSSR
jgi:hypothetical protein